MRIEINGNGGVVASYQNKLDTLYDRINDTIEALQKVNRDISDVNGVKNGNLQLAQSSIDSRIRIEENKRDKVFRLQQQSNTFFDHAVEVDKRVAATIEQNEKQFYEKHPHLAPVPMEQKIWNWLCEQWEEFCDGAEKIWEGIVAFVKEHVVELIVGAVTLAIAAVLTFISGGALLPLVVGVLKGMLVSGMFSAAISAFTGGDIMDAFFDGLADGFMWGGIFALAANIVNVVKNILKFGKINVVDDVANVADDVVDDIMDAGHSVSKTGVGNTNISIENFTAKDVPSVKNGEFNKFFDSLSVDELDTLWSKPEIRDVIEARLRSPGGLHEWLLVSRTPKFKYWNISAEKIKSLRSVTSEVKFINPSGIHGGRGSTIAHNELIKIIDTSNDFETFVRRLNNWANYRLEGGINALPEGLRIK